MATKPYSHLVARIPASVPFVGPEAIERRESQRFRVRAGANESAFGISPQARAAMASAVPTVSHYGDPENFDLRSALAERHETTIDHILVGSGIDGLFALLMHTLVDPGTPVVTSLGSYPTFNYFVTAYGGKLVSVPYSHDHTELSRLTDEAARQHARVLYLANPDNPTGTCHDRRALDEFVECVPDDCILVLDEAYSDFVPPEELHPINVGDSRVVHLRTFSKAHGMAGLRIGYAVACRELISACNKVRIQFGVNRLAQIGALASLQDSNFIRDVVAEVARGRSEYEELGRELGLRTLPSQTNFVSFDFGEAERAGAVLKSLESRGVFVRSGVSPNNRLIRVTVGTEPERAEFAEALRAVVDPS